MMLKIQLHKFTEINDILNDIKIENSYFEL